LLTQEDLAWRATLEWHWTPPQLVSQKADYLEQSSGQD